MATIEEIHGELKTKQSEIAKIFADKPNFDFTAEELSDVQSKQSYLTSLKQDYDNRLKLAEQANRLKQEMEELQDLPTFAGTKDNKSPTQNKGQKSNVPEFDSLGDYFINSAAYKNYNSATKEGPTSDYDVNLKTVFQTTTANSVDPGWQPQAIRNGVVVEYPVRTPKMDQVIRMTNTNSPTIMYQKVTLWTNGAGAVGEDDATARESAFKLEDATAVVKKLRVSIPISDDMLEDGPYMRDFVNNQLLAQLALKKDEMLLSGDGLNGNLLGLLNTSGILTRAVADNEPVTDAVHRAMTQVLLTGRYSANGIVMHPSDWEDIRLMKTADGVYIYGPPTTEGPKILWGINVVDTDGITENTALIGAFDVACTQAIRRGVTMTMSTEHSDNFMRGRLTIKLEMRLAIVVYRPTSILKLTKV